MEGGVVGWALCREMFSEVRGENALISADLLERKKIVSLDLGQQHHTKFSR